MVSSVVPADAEAKALVKERQKKDNHNLSESCRHAAEGGGGGQRSRGGGNRKSHLHKCQVKTPGDVFQSRGGAGSTSTIASKSWETSSPKAPTRQSDRRLCTPP